MQAGDEHTRHDPTVINAIRSNADLLHAVLAQLTEVQLLVDAQGCIDQEIGIQDAGISDLNVHDSEWKVQAAGLRQKIQELESENSELHSQNQELAAQIAKSKIQGTAPENSLESGECSGVLDIYVSLIDKVKSEESLSRYVSNRSESEGRRVPLVVGGRVQPGRL